MRSLHGFAIGTALTAALASLPALSQNATPGVPPTAAPMATNPAVPGQGGPRQVVPGTRVPQNLPPGAPAIGAPPAGNNPVAPNVPTRAARIGAPRLPNPDQPPPPPSGNQQATGRFTPPTSWRHPATRSPGLRPAPPARSVARRRARTRPPPVMRPPTVLPLSPTPPAFTPAITTPVGPVPAPTPLLPHP